jgi:NAD(P)-dependent dehydrogenase (short-subunit alcohol dehydrogenase family)
MTSQSGSTAGHAADDWPANLTTRSLAVIVVAHNDAAGLAATIERLHRAVLVTTEDFEIAIFDDGSTDHTPAIARDLTERFSGVRMIRSDTRMGAGRCFARGCRETTANFVVYVPADNTWPHRSYVELFGNIGKADIIASYSSNLHLSMPPQRRLVSWAYTTMLNAVFRFGLHYYNGLTIYPASFLRVVVLGASGFGFQAEALIRAVSAGYSFLEVALPIDDASAVKSRSVTLRNIADAVGMMMRLASQFYLAPASLKVRRIRQNPVKMGPTVDELGLRARPSRTPMAQSPPEDLRIAITGASSGIGEALARALGGAGYRLFICARREEKLAEIARQVPTVHAIACDVTDEAQVTAFVSAIAAQAGGLDVLINCAGAFGEIGPLASTDSLLWWETMRLNLFGSYLMIKHCLPLLEQGRKARIINLAGGGAFSPFPNYSAYACSKAALVRLTECLAVELQPRNIRVNAIAPGIVATDIHRATLAAGEERAGRLQYRRTLSIMNDGGPSAEELIECVRAMLSPSFNLLTGKTISSNFDPWQTDSFLAHIDDIASSDLYTLRRLNVANLNEGYLRKTLAQAWADFGSAT